MNRGVTRGGVRRVLLALTYRTVSVCFACGRPGHAPCEGHEYGGMIRQRRMRLAGALIRRIAGL